MATMGDLVVNLGFNGTAWQAGLANAGKQLQGFNTQVTSAGTLLRNFGGGLLGATPLAGLLGAAGVGAGFVAFLTRAVEEQREAVRVGRMFEAVQRAMGNASGYSTAQLREYAVQLQRVTNFGDDTTIQAMALLATFGNVGGPVFKEATALAQDMSEVLGQDLNSSIMQVGKALNDPIQGMTALRRIGVSFNESQRNQITLLQQSGDLAGAQQVILNELRREFGGAAREMADPWKQMKNSVGDAMESVGSLLLPTINQAANGIKDLAERLSEAMRSSEGLGESIAEWAGQAWDLPFLSAAIPGGVALQEWLRTAVQLHSLLFGEEAPAMSEEDIAGFEDEFIGARMAERAIDRVAALQAEARRLAAQYDEVGSATRNWRIEQDRLYGAATTPQARGARIKPTEDLIADTLKARDEAGRRLAGESAAIAVGLAVDPRASEAVQARVLEIARRIQAGVLPQHERELRDLAASLQAMSAADQAAAAIRNADGELRRLTGTLGAVTVAQKKFAELRLAGVAPEIAADRARRFADVTAQQRAAEQLHQLRVAHGELGDEILGTSTQQRIFNDLINRRMNPAAARAMATEMARERDAMARLEVIRANRTPGEQFAAEQRRLAGLGLSADQYGRAMERLRQQYAGSVLESIRTPEEKLRERMRELQDLMRSGALTPAEYGRAVAQAQMQAEGEGPVRTGALEAGTTEAWHAILQAMDAAERSSREAEMARTAEETARNTDRAAIAMEELLAVARSDRALTEIP